MTLCELLTVIKWAEGGSYEVYINRDWELPTFNYDCIENTIDEWITGFSCADVWWGNRYNDGEDGTLAERHEWEMEILFAEAELMNEEGPYGEPAGHWINVSQ